MKRFIYLLLTVLIFIILNTSCNKQSNTKQYSNENEADNNISEISNAAPAPSNQQNNQVLQKLYSYPQNGIPVLMYHSISTEPDNTLCVSKEQFGEEMAWLHSNNYHTLSMDDFYEALINRGRLPENPVLITFDDGYKDNYEAARPILEQYGYVATFFIVTDYVNQYRIDWDQLKDLISKGNSIGSHSVGHRDLSTLSAEQQEKELKDSKQILEDHLGISIKAFCFPSGKFDQTTLTLLPEAGYALSFSTKSGKVHIGDNRYSLNRVGIMGGSSLSKFISQVSYHCNVDSGI
jgi:peptidoglycan/xylan/chitin deacetylase (PgdA/CDA1 family)